MQSYRESFTDEQTCEYNFPQASFRHDNTTFNDGYVVAFDSEQKCTANENRLFTVGFKVSCTKTQGATFESQGGWSVT